MKQLFFAHSSSAALFAQQNESDKEPDPNKKVHEVETSCGQCKLGLEGMGCMLAIRLDGGGVFCRGL